MKKVLTGLDVLCTSKELQSNFKGNVALLCHNASINANFVPAALKFKEIFANKFVKLFGPQHGFSTDAQDNMIETDHFTHPFLNVPVYSLYSETRIPSDLMLENIDHLFVDLQDVGCRMYTYIYTLTLLLEKCADMDIEIIVLDRPNPINGIDLEGNILDMKFASFIGLHPIPVRHGLTIAELALMHQKNWVSKKANLKIIKMENWERSMYYKDTGLPWILPSPNLAREDSCVTFPAMVLFEGTKLSEGRGTSQPLEIMGHPKIDAYDWYSKHLKNSLITSKLEGFSIRPISFLPTFQKQANLVCEGFQLHITDVNTFKPWRAGQWLMQETYHYLGEHFQWKEGPYEYDYTNKPIDIINGTDQIRKWIENKDSLTLLDQMESLEAYKDLLNEIKIYT